MGLLTLACCLFSRACFFFSSLISASRTLARAWGKGDSTGSRRKMG